MNHRISKRPATKFRRRAKDLTPQRILVLKALDVFIETHSYPPSMRELAQRLKLSSPSTVHAHLESLEMQDLVERQHGKARAWRLTSEGRSLTLAHREDFPEAA